MNSSVVSIILGWWRDCGRAQGRKEGEGRRGGLGGGNGTEGSEGSKEGGRQKIGTGGNEGNEGRSEGRLVISRRCGGGFGGGRGWSGGVRVNWFLMRFGNLGLQRAVLWCAKNSHTV